MEETDGLVYSYLLDGKGGGRRLGWDGVRSWRPEQGVLWVHLNYAGSESARWLREEAGLDELTYESLVAEDPRPRSVATDGRLLVFLRGVNLNPGADPEDMVSVRAVMDSTRIVTLRRRKVMATDDIQAAIEAGDGPTATGDFLAGLANSLMDRMGGVLEDLDDAVDGLEDEVLTAESYELRPKIAMLRRQAISLRRYLAPQRDALLRLQMEKADWLCDICRLHLREAADRMTRYVEDLDSARERASVTHEELDGRLSERMNRTMYILSIVATIFLPLSFLTGLLGINVGGIPGADNPEAFIIVCALAAVLAAFMVYLFKRKKWL